MTTAPPRPTPDGTVVPDAVPASATMGWRVDHDDFDDTAGLGAREVEVLAQTALGRSADQIARALLLPVATIDDLRRGAWSAAGVTDREEALAWAVGSGLLRPVVVETPGSALTPAA